MLCHDVTNYIYDKLSETIKQRYILNECEHEEKTYTFNVHMKDEYIHNHVVDAFVSKLKNHVLVSEFYELVIEGPVFSEENCFINKTLHNHARWYVTIS